MFAKFRTALHAKIFPCHKALMAMFEENAQSVAEQTLARERLQAACQEGLMCYQKQSHR